MFLSIFSMLTLNNTIKFIELVNTRYSINGYIKILIIFLFTIFLLVSTSQKVPSFNVKTQERKNKRNNDKRKYIFYNLSTCRCSDVQG